MRPDSPIRIATRGSQLARWQAEWVAGQVRSLGLDVQIVEVSTVGDRQDKQQIANLGTRGVFTKEIQQAVLDGRADVAVHSFKDLPTDPAPGMAIAAVPEREDPADALVTGAAASLDSLPVGARVGTSSVRRRAQLLRLRPDLRVVDIRGNVDTRLAKLEGGQIDAVVLAVAGLVRLGYANRITQRLEPNVLLSAVGQGALAIECRQNDAQARQLLSRLDHAPTRTATHVERLLLGRLRAGCLAPVGALAVWSKTAISLRAVVLSGDGRSKLSFHGLAPPDQPEQLAETAANRLLADGAERLLSRSRG